MRSDNERMDIVGIGIGPANLSLAALVQPCRDVKSRFLERRNEFLWHPGLLLPNAELQVAYIKDLVSLVDPTSRFSFLSFLHSKKRLHSFINANFRQVLRREFNEYYRWVCAQLTNLQFACDVEEIHFDGNGIALLTSRGMHRTQHLAVGTGLEPYIPKCCDAHLGDNLFHASCYLAKEPRTAGRRIAVVGGGQTGAEIFLHLLSDGASPPSEVFWISRRLNFLPLDETPFINDQFTPNYSDYFFDLPPAAREKLVAEQKLTSDGISTSLLETIYRRLYELKFLDDNACRWQLRPGRAMEGITRVAGGFSILTRQVLTGIREHLAVDLVVLCTGYAAKLPSCLNSVRDCINLSATGGYVLNADFSIEWAGHPMSRIYVQNAARVQRGLADPNLSLLSWRSAKIVNSVASRAIYELADFDSIIDWNDSGSGAFRQYEPLRSLQLS